MKYFEIRCKAYIKKDIDFKGSFEVISKYISFSMAQIEKLKTIHNQNGFKYYSFGNFFPIEKEKVYKSGDIYSFVIRSLDKEFISSLSQLLRKNVDNPNFLVLETTMKVIKHSLITELYSATPVIVSIADGMYWSMDRDGDIIKLQKQLHNNLEKKYQEFYKESIKSSQTFIQLLEIKNRYPQSIYTHIKNKNRQELQEVRFFGNKFRIVPNEDEISQKLAFIALACGLGEKNSFGGGFCLGKGLR